MKRAFLAALIVSLLASCDSAGQQQPAELRALTAPEQRSVQADHAFGLRLFRQINAAQPGENVFVSPLSVSFALGMTLNGAAGQTRAEMEAVLERSGLSPEEINAAYESLLALLTTVDPEVVFTVANSIWHREGFAVEPAFLATNRAYFDAEVEAADFGPATVARINGWVDDATRGRITEVLDAIPPEAVMYLVNAIYFKGTWRYEFDPEHTRKAAFHLPTGGTTPIELMSLEGDLPYAEGDGFRAVDLPYGDSLFSMTVLLPDEGRSVDEVAASLTAERWSTLVEGFTPRAVALELPKFKLEYKRELKDDLAVLGMPTAFTEQADFTGINRKGELFISRVLHKSFVEVNEEGTEAAAVTVVEVSVECAGCGGGRISFRVDRPFVFAIRERHSGALLFIGKLTNPPA